MSEIQTPYERLGGDEAVRRLCITFYQIMSDTPQTQIIRSMHPKEIKTSEDKLYMFLSGWLGGPPLFEEKFGHPRLKGRHLPYAIGIEERDQWLYCMAQALKTMDLESVFSEQLMAGFVQTADFMRNKEE